MRWIMARGPSGRVVLEVDPNLKRQLHAQVALEGKTLKDWFLEAADHYLTEAGKRQLAGFAERVAEHATAYRKSKRRGSRREAHEEITSHSVRGGSK